MSVGDEYHCTKCLEAQWLIVAKAVCLSDISSGMQENNVPSTMRNVTSLCCRDGLEGKT
jgi:hypothetical protein